MLEIQTKIKGYLKERGWDKNEPSDLAKSIMIEGAELLEIFQWDNSSISKIKKDKKKYIEIQKELADVFIYSLGMACVLDMDTEKIIDQKLQHVEKKYPVKKIKNNQKNYLKIKREYRKKGI